MTKKEFPNKEEPLAELEGEEFGPEPNRFSAFFSGLSGKLFGIIKFILGICLLPFVYSVTTAYLREFSHVGKTFENYLWLGAIILVLIYFFIWEPAIVYSRGQKLLEFVFNFFKPFVKIAPYVLPVYAIIIFVIYELLANIIKSPWLTRYALFLLGFSFALHIIYSAKTLRSKKSDFLKGNYIFGFSFIYTLNILLLALFMSLIFEKFSFVDFFSAAFSLAKDIFYSVFKQLFIPSP